MSKFAILLLMICLAWTKSGAQYPAQVIVEPLLKSDTTSVGQKIHYPKFDNAEVTALKITLKPGKSTGWHKHDIPLFAYIIQGTLTVDLGDGKQRTFEAGSAVAEAIGLWHQGINKGTDDLVLIAFYLGGKGMPLSVPKETDR